MPTYAEPVTLAIDGAVQLTELLQQHLRHNVRSLAVYQTLREAITLNILPEGCRLQERWLAGHLGVSRTPVREALQRLETEGFVVNHSRLGFMAAVLTVHDIEEVYAMRIVLEGLAARLAAIHAMTGDVSMLKAIQRKFEQAHRRGDVDGARLLNMRFHDALCQAAQSARLVATLTCIRDSLQRLKHTTLSGRARRAEAIEEHRGLIAAIEARDADRAERLIKAHLERARQLRVVMYSRAAENRDVLPRRSRSIASAVGTIRSNTGVARSR